MNNKDFINAALIYSDEIDSLGEDDNETLNKLRLNAGLAYLEAKSFNKAEEFLNIAINESSEFEEIQSKALNALGNLYYYKANSFLDQQNVINAKKSWEKAREYYKNSLEIDTNASVQKNLESLNDQILDGVEPWISKVKGLVWRDINGNKKREENEPLLKARIFWDKNDDGEHNESLGPAIPGNEMGQFAFEWIPETYPDSLRLASVLSDQNESSPTILEPVPKNHSIEFEKKASHFIHMPWRASPYLKGRVWNDTNVDGKLDNNESGSSAATLFIDENDNYQLDENETSFKPSEDGSFFQVVLPSKYYSLCIKPDNPEANVTYPKADSKNYITSANFEQASPNFLFGIQAPPGEGNSSKNSSQEQAKPEDNQDSSSPPEKPEPTHAEGERMLQEIDNETIVLGEDTKIWDPAPPGRNY
ncbi:hypothetical protein N9H22_02065 [Opitutales bacterium]|nr:hypothetical protein [Opitutales bacterium]